MKIAILCEPASHEEPETAMRKSSVRLVKQTLEKAGLDPRAVTWVPLCRPIEKQDIKSAARRWAHIKPETDRILAAVANADVVVPLGAEASRIVLGGKPVQITKVRGIRHEIDGQVVFPTLSPASAAYDDANAKKLQIDVNGLRALIDAGGKQDDRPRGDYRWVSECAWLRKLKFAAIDTEAYNRRWETGGTALDWTDPHTRLLMLQVTWTAGKTAVIPLHAGYWKKVFGTTAGFREAMGHVRAFLNDPAIGKVGHNAKYDLHALNNRGFPVRGLTDDTMLMAWFADENQKLFNLNECSNIWLPEMAGFNDVPESQIEDKGRMHQVPLDVMLRYAGGDTDATFRLYMRLRTELEKTPAHYRVYRTVKVPGLLAYTRLEEEGVYVDQDELEKVSREFNETYARLHDEFVEKHMPWQVKEKHLLEAEDKIRSTRRKELHRRVEEKRALLLESGDPAAIKRAEKSLRAALEELPTLGEKSYRDRIKVEDVISLTRPDLVRDVFFSKEGFDLDAKKHTASTEDLDDEDSRIPSSSIKHLKLFLSELTGGNSEHVADAIRALAEISTLDKMISTYVGSPEDREGKKRGIWKYLKASGRYHASFHFLTVTGRTGSREPNDQNIPVRSKPAKRLKAAWKSPDDDQWVKIAADLSQIELRLVGWEANEAVMLDAYRTGKDLHANTGAGLVGLSYEQFMAMAAEERREPRQNAKPVNFGYAYGQHAKSFRDFAEQQYNVVLTLEQAKEFRDKFFCTYPGLVNWHIAKQEEACRHGFVTSLHGQRRRLPELKGADFRDFNSLSPKQRDALRQAINSGIQGLGSDINVYAVALLQAQGFEWLRLNRSIHDALYAYVRRGHEAAGIQAMVYAMQSFPWDVFGNRPPVPIISEPDIGFRDDRMIELSEPPKVGEGPDWFEAMRDDLMVAKKGDRPSFWMPEKEVDLTWALNQMPARTLHAA